MIGKSACPRCGERIFYTSQRDYEQQIQEHEERHAVAAARVLLRMLEQAESQAMENIKKREAAGWTEADKEFLQDVGISPL